MAGMIPHAGPDLEAEAQRQKTALLYRSAGIAMAASAVNASLVAYVNATLHATAGAAGGWLSLVIALAGWRYVLARRFQAASPDASAAMTWRHRYIRATAVIAAAWGVGTVLFMWDAPDGARLFTGLAVCGMVAASVSILAPVPAAFQAFALLVNLPMAAVILLQATSALHWAFGILALVFLGAVLASGRYLHETLDASIRLGLEKGRLLENLERAGRAAEAALEASNLSLWDFDIGAGRVYLDENWVKIVGGQAGERVTSIAELAQAIHPDDSGRAARSAMAAIKGVTPDYREEIRFRSADGNWKWISCRGKVVERRADRWALRAVGTNLDISDRKRTEEALQTSEARFRLLASATFEGVAITEKGRFVDANDQLLNMLGYPREELIGLAIVDLLPAADHDRVMDNVRSGRESHIEHGMLCKDGRCIQVEAHGQTINTGARPIRITALRDITARKQSEAELEQHRHHLEDLVQQRTAALQETEARASHILFSSADGLYGVDHDGIITFINPAACEKLGYEAGQVIGRSAHAVFHHSRPDGTPYPVDSCPSHNAVTLGQKVRVDNEVYWHADGHAVPVMYAVHPMLQNGVSTGAVISFVDMSEQRAAAEAREQALIAAENLARVRSEFLANMSHEIRTPLNGVLGFASIGHRNYRDPEKARNAFEKILSSGNILLGVINDILDFSKIEAGRIHIEQTEVSLVTMMDHALELVGDRARAKGLELRIERAPDLPERCMTDQLRLSQVLLNVLSNAVKFTETGSVTLSVSRQDEKLVFRVTDTGIGMNEEQLGRLFNPFQQADGSITRKFGGTGLGLAISRRILELMGGEIRVESQPGVGSTFEFRLPYVQAAAPAADRTPARIGGTAPTGKPLAGICILVAEDNIINQMVLEEYLIEAGANVVLAGDGLDAVERVTRDGRDAYDIALMDVQMPRMDGYVATRRILELAPDLPIIGQTAHALGEDREKCLAAGMVAHIAKPIDPAALVDLVRKHVSAKLAH